MDTKAVLVFCLKRISTLICLLVCTYSIGYAQGSGFRVQGKVSGADIQEPLIGATVHVEGTTIGVITDFDGNYTLQIPQKGKVKLVVSYIGYKPQTIVVSADKLLNVVLESNTEVLEDVVVIGYGTQTKASVTGAMSSIDNKELIKAPVADVSNVLAGQVPGVSTVQNSGQPGKDEAQLFIRGAGSLTSGSSAPLILVDGVERPMSSIDPNEIESLSILKDASSTAVFGVRGANGVVIITTKRGQVGKPTISVSSITGLQQPMSYVEQTGSYDYATFYNQKQRNDNVTDPLMYFTREAIEAYRTGSDPIMYPSVDWSKEMFNKFFLQTKNNINISGGSESVRYFVSLGMMYQNGVLKQLEGSPYDNNFSYNRYNYRTNLDFDLTQTTKMKFNIGGVIGMTQEPRPIEGVDYAWTYAKIWAVPMASPGMINGLRTFVPTSMLPDIEARDGFGAFYGWGYDQYYNTRLNMDVEITQDLSMLTKGLSVSAKGSYDNVFRLNKYRVGNGLESQKVYYKTHLDDPTIPTTDPHYDKSYVYIPSGANTPLSYSEDYGRDRNWYLEFKVNYDRTFNQDHKVTGLLLYNQSKDYYPTNLPFQYIPRSYVGLVGRATYGYKHKYLADFSVGYNGSENFAPGKTRFGLFPSMSLGYVLSEENFMANQNIVDYFKLRASVGKVGNDMGTSSRFMYMQSVWNPGGDYSFGVNNPNGWDYYLPGAPGNKDVTWETAVKYNLGVDVNFLDNRLTANVDYFFENRTNILITPQIIPSIIATSLADLNIGEVENKGYEVMLSWRDQIGDGFAYSINANMSFARNKIIYMDEIQNDLAYKNQTGGSTGRNANVYKFEGIYGYDDFVEDAHGNSVLNPDLPQPQVRVYPGDAKYADLNGDGIVNSDDKMVTGYSTRPEYVFGLNADMSYKGWNFNMQWTGATNVEKMMSIEYRIPFTNAGGRGLLEYFHEDCWSPTNQDGTLPRAAEASENWNAENSTLWLRDASYIRLKSLNFGYTFTDKTALKRLGISSLGLMFTGYNLLTFSPMKFEDPETVASIQGDYPLVKTYNLGITINF